MSEFGGESVVISGLSCRLPQSDNINEFRDNLMNGIDMVTEDDSRWEPGLYGLPRRNGKIKDLSKFDAAFFGVHHKQANRMDPQLRLLLEVSYEAIVDAGHDPSQLRGTNTGVFIGATGSEAHALWSRDPGSTQGYTITGCNRAMLANRLSFYFDFKGPSYTVDTACSSSLLALDQALNSIRNGKCEAAIVGGSNVCLKTSTSLQFMRLGMLSPEGKCRSFDANGQGYVRSEGVVAVFLQKKPNAKRIYCTVLHSKTNSDGHKDQGITFPSGQRQKELLLELYNEVSIDPALVTYVEAHGTGTKAGDPPELNTICDVFCNSRQGPLLIGSVKSNMGHSEAASGLAAIAKVIIAMENKTIPSNLHYQTPNEEIPGLSNGKLQVVTQNTDWRPGLVGVNSFGFGGTNVHVLLEPHHDNREPSTSDSKDFEGKRLLVYSARTKEGLDEVLEKVLQSPTDIALHTLLNETACMSPSWHQYRGFTVLNGSGQLYSQKVDTSPRPVWYVFAGMGSQWGGMARDMMQIDKFRKSILETDTYLKPLGFELYDMLMHGESSSFESPLNAFVAIAAIQIALVDLLTAVGITPDGIIGHSVGELGCAYADGCFTAQETVLAAYWRGHCIQTADLPPGGMAAVGLTWKEAHERCPPGVVPACHNAEDTVTISGPKEAVQSFVSKLQADNVFAKEVNSSGVAFHSQYMKEVASHLDKALKEVITSSKPRSKKWISSSIPESQWDTELARYSSAEYHVNNLVSPVLFQEALQHVPDNALVIEIAPHCLLQAILKRSLSSECCIVGLMNRKETDNVEHFLTTLGKCFQNGLDLNPLKLVKDVSFPVPSGTPMVSPLIKWDHSQTWDVPRDQPSMTDTHTSNGFTYEVDISPDSENSYLKGHKLDGRILFPASGYLTLVWKALAMVEGIDYEEMAIEFQDVSFIRATILPTSGKTCFRVMLTPGTGHFEIIEGGSVTTTGKVFRIRNSDLAATVNEEIVVRSTEFELSTSEVYRLFRIRGYDYGGDFLAVVNADLSGHHGKLSWTGNWVTFMDTMLQLIVLTTPGNKLRVPSRVRSVVIDPKWHKCVLDNAENGVIQVVNRQSVCRAGGVTIKEVHTPITPRRSDKHKPVLEKYVFIPYIDTEPVTASEDLKAYAAACKEAANKFSDPKTPKKLSISLEKNGVVMNGVKSSDTHLANTTNVTNECYDGDKYSYLAYLENRLSEQNNFMKDIPGHRPNLEKDCLLNALFRPDILKVCLDIVIENTKTNILRIAEVGDTGMSHFLQPVLNGAVIQTTYSILTSEENVAINPESETRCQYIHWSSSSINNNSIKPFHLATLNNVLHRQADIAAFLHRLADIIETEGFILIHERTHNFNLAGPLDNIEHGSESISGLHDRTSSTYCNIDKWHELFDGHGLEVIFERRDPFMSTLFLLRKRRDVFDLEKQIVVSVSDKDYSWVETVKERLKEISGRPNGEYLWIATSAETSGIIGMVNCLRKEPDGGRIRCMFGAELNVFDVLSKDGKKNLAMNVYRHGFHGSMRHLPIQKGITCATKHAFVNVLNDGDLSSLRWIESPLSISKRSKHDDEDNQSSCSIFGCFQDKSTTSSHPVLAYVYYASLNFRDIMLASGRLSTDAIPNSHKYNDCLLGLEFSGIDHNGRFVMGLVPAKGLATSVEVPQEFLWFVPSTWTLEEAATVPVVYSTAYYALVVRGNIQTGDRVLVHSGSGGVGQAAIAVALHYNCTVYTTVGSQEKREYLMKKFPRLKPQHFYSSRDTAFEQEILIRTQGRGVDIVLNSLSEDKLLASVRVLAQHGRFLEIGKVDLSNNSSLGMGIFLKNTSFHGILLDALFEPNNKDFEKVSDLLREGIKQGTVRPLDTTVFRNDELEQAFRYMAQGKHIGKVLIKVKNNQKTIRPQVISAIPRSYFYDNKCYIIVGGLGGFGVELCQWMAERGARYIVLTSRSGVTTGYQAMVLEKLKTLGVCVRVSKRDVSVQEEAKCLLQESGGLPVGGIFNLAAVLHDGLFENQSKESFQKVSKPKVDGTVNLDKFSRMLCKKTCDWFVVFSSVSSGYGNAGQSNYGFANSAMERICEKRKRDDLPGLAIQWGAIGDVGMILDSFGDNDTNIGGTSPQRITSCLTSLDKLFNQFAPVVSCYVPAEKQALDKTVSNVEVGVVETICRILGISEPKSVSPDINLGDLGLDSLMGVEVKHALERSFDISMSMKDIRQLTLNGLHKIANENGSKISQAKHLDAKEDIATKIIPDEIVVKLNNVNDSHATPIYFIHPIEGSVECFEAVAALINVPVFGIQCTRDVPLTSIQDIAAYYIQVIREHNNQPTFHLAGYSIGACISIEMTHQSDSHMVSMTMDNRLQHSVVESLTVLEGSHKSVGLFNSAYKNSLEIKSLDTINSSDEVSEVVKDSSGIMDLKYKVVDALLKANPGITIDDVNKALQSYNQKLLDSGARYKLTDNIHRGVVLVKAEHGLSGIIDIEEDFGLSEVFTGDIDVHTVSGDHISFLKDGNEANVADIINANIDKVNNPQSHVETDETRL